MLKNRVGRETGTKQFILFGLNALVNVDPQGGDRGTTQGILTGPKSVCQNPVGVMSILCQKVGKYPGSLAEIKDDRSA